jgi:hypothetical protein
LLKKIVNHLKKDGVKFQPTFQVLAQIFYFFGYMALQMFSSPALINFGKIWYEQYSMEATRQFMILPGIIKKYNMSIKVKSS